MIAKFSTPFSFLLLSTFCLFAQQNDIVDSLKFQNKNSISRRLQSNSDSVKSIENTIKQHVDSLDAGLEVAHHVTRLDSIKGKLTGRIDSLSALPNPNRLHIKQLDSLRGSIDSLKQKFLQLPPGVKHTQESFGKLQASVAEKTNKIGSAVNEKLSLFNKNGATGLPGDLKLPSPSGLALPGGNLNLGGKNLDLSLQQSSMPGVDVKGLEIPDNLQQDLSLPSLDKPDLNGIKGMDELKDLTGKAGDIGKTTGEIGGYADKLKDPESMGKELETKAAGLDELKGLQGNMDKVSEIKDWKSDPDYLKEVAFKKAKEQVTDHFAGHDKELLAAMDQLSKVKAKFKDADGVIDMFKEYIVHSFITSGKMRFILLHEGKNDDSIKYFFQEVYEYYCKALLNPFIDKESVIFSKTFDAKVQNSLKKNLN